MLRPWLVVALASSVLIAAGCGEREAASSESPCADSTSDEGLQDKGRVAFAAGRAQGSELMVVDVETKKSRRVTHKRNPHDSVSTFAWSPDGQAIAYSAGTGGWTDKTYDDIWVVPWSGGQPSRLTDSYEDDWDPSWSPDGRRLAFDRQDDGYNWIYVIDADGTGLRRLTANFNYDPVWTPDGRISYLDDRGIWVMHADGSDKRLLARLKPEVQPYGGTPMVWSPDGEAVAFISGGELWVMNANGTGRRKLSGGGGKALDPVWSPDSQKIAWADIDSDLEIFVVNRDGSELRNVTNNKRVQDRKPAWSPNGRAIAFLRFCGASEAQRMRAFAINLDGSGAQSLSSFRIADRGQGPAWSR